MPIGMFISISVPNPMLVWIENVAVHPDHQHRGIGRRLVAFAEQRARAAHVLEVRLYTNERMVENICVFTSRAAHEHRLPPLSSFVLNNFSAKSQMNDNWKAASPHHHHS